MRGAVKGINMRRTTRLAARAGAHAPVGFGDVEQLEPRVLLVFNPTAREQFMLELLNRMRANPAAELGLLTNTLGNPAGSADPNVDEALLFFGVNGTILQQQWAELTAAPPLAWNEHLYNAAAGHNQAMIDGNVQSHRVVIPSLGINEDALGDRVTSAGYTGWSTLGENVYAYGKSVPHAHASFAIDWGSGPHPDSGLPPIGGIQNPPGHRQTMMNAQFREVGIRINAVADPGSTGDVGPLVITQDFGVRPSITTSTILGVVYDDPARNGYNIGEGIGSVTVTATAMDGAPGAQTFTTTSMTAGGWQLALPAGTYAVTFSGGTFGDAVTFHTIVVGAQNVKLDAVKGVRPPSARAQVSGNAREIAAGDITPSAADNTDFGNANRDGQTITKTFLLRNTGSITLTITGIPRIVITGANSGEFTLVQDVASASLAAGASSGFMIQFDPDAVGLRKATVTISSNDPDAPSYSFDIQGRGVRRAVVGVTGKSIAIPNGDTSPTTADWTNFGGVDIEGGSKVRVFTVTNTGLFRLGFTGAAPVTISGPGARFFQVTLQPSGHVLPGETAQFRIRFAPTTHARGFQSALITLATNDPLTPTYSFWIRANGLMRPRAAVIGNNAIILNGDTSPSLYDFTDFGTVNVDGGTRARQYTITNFGLGIFTLTGSPRVTVSGPNASDFVVTLQPADNEVYTGEAQVFRVRFDASAIGLREATITIEGNDPAGVGGAFTFAIAGIGRA